MIDTKNYTTHKVNMLTVIGISKDQDGNGKIWDLSCECGGTTTLRTSQIRREVVKSCGCLNHRKGLDSPSCKGKIFTCNDCGKRLKEDWKRCRKCQLKNASVIYAGIEFNNIKILGYSGDKSKGGEKLWNAECKLCGKQWLIHRTKVSEKKQISCGCHRYIGWTKEDYERRAEARDTTEYKKWSASILKRDNYTCAKCGNNAKLNVHHIHSWKMYREKVFDNDNAVVLCKGCHTEFHKTYGYHNFKPQDTLEYINKEIAT